MKHVDARGFSCPEPVLLTKQAVESGDNQIEVMTSSNTSKENVERYLIDQGYKTVVEDMGAEFKITGNK